MMGLELFSGLETMAWWTVPLLIWATVWKGLALWKAGNSGHKWWFIALFLINTLGILEILYIYVFSKRIKKTGANS